MFRSFYMGNNMISIINIDDENSTKIHPPAFNP